MKVKIIVPVVGEPVSFVEEKINTFMVGKFISFVVDFRGNLLIFYKD